MAARKGMAIPPPSNQPKMDISEQEEFERFLAEVADGEERNRRREEEQKRQEWEETKKYLADKKDQRVQSGSGPQVARQGSSPQITAKGPVPVSPRGPVLAGSPSASGLEASWSRVNAKPSGTGSPLQQRSPAPPSSPSPSPLTTSDDGSHPKLIANSNNSGMTLVPLAQAQAQAQAQVRARTGCDPLVSAVDHSRSVSPQGAPRAASPQRVGQPVVVAGARPPSGAQRALPTSAPPTAPSPQSSSPSISPRTSGNQPAVAPIAISPRTSGTQPPLSPRGNDLEARRAELEEQKKRLAEMRQRVTENYGKTLIDQLKLTPHSEGGYFREIYRSTENMDRLPSRFGGGPRSYATAIYFLLLKGQVSRWHRLRSDELWHFYGGDPVDIYVLDSLGLNKYTLGTALNTGEAFVLPVPHGVWFAAIAKEDKAGWSLVGCTMSPGFDYKDWELANIQQLCAAYPANADVINALAM